MAFRAALRNPRSGRIEQAARTLDEHVMRRVRGLLGGKRRIFISPDGALNLIPFGALSDEHNRYLVKRYTFTYLTSGRDLLRLRNYPSGRQQPVVIANPSFDSAAMPADGQTVSESRSVDISRRSTDYREKFTPLSGTAEEGTDVGGLLNVTPLTGPQATESVLKSAEGPHILHMATHGFFLPTRQPRPRDYPFLNTSNQLSAGLGESPLLRSGIALAGANKLQGGGVEDGILTALEVSGLNLLGTELIVLSACETGLGDVRLGEGVYGLRRAFVLAGAKSQMMSLWKVDDEVTRNFMGSYYRQLLAGRGKGEALRNIQLDMLKGDDRSHPYFWAGFILSGDWRALGNAGRYRK
jgi:CHAT domain-containing protein